MISSEDLMKLEKQLGRSPRGVKEIVCYNSNKWPRVVRVSPFVAGKPFPSHYWLSCEILKKAIDQLEAQGWAKKIEVDYIAADEQFRQKVWWDHQKYIEQRIKFLKQDGLLENIDERFKDAIEKRGVGGIQDFNRVRCLHMHYAHHLAEGSTIGQLMDDLFELNKL